MYIYIYVYNIQYLYVYICWCDIYIDFLKLILLKGKLRNLHHKFICLQSVR